MSERVIVMGASADGIQAIGHVLAQLPAGFAAPVLIVQHVGRHVPSILHEILARTSRLPVLQATDGQRMEPGHVYVAPSARHMVVHDGEIRLSDGPEENRFRPAVDVLFRSAAMAHGAHVVGVVLTGYLNDGAAGLLAIKDRGGVAIIQDPADASVPDMPRAALMKVPAGEVRRVSEIGPLLVELVADASSATRDAPTTVELENRIASGTATGDDLRTLLEQSTQVAMTCPTCTLPLYELADPRLRRFRCGSGHAFSEIALPRLGDASLQPLRVSAY
jgi:two-component system, chemotaxis family, protein-glutamate methylesterase/glutaminase